MSEMGDFNMKSKMNDMNAFYVTVNIAFIVQVTLVTLPCYGPLNNIHPID